MNTVTLDFYLSNTTKGVITLTASHPY